MPVTNGVLHNLARNIVEAVKPGLTVIGKGFAANVVLEMLVRELKDSMDQAREDAAFRRSVSAMLGWGNNPPQETIERQLSILKERAFGRPSLGSRDL
jgi:hypothetical protein